jgi:triosephosphate isomerase
VRTKKPIVAANWKMYKTPQEGVSFVSEICNLLLDKEKPTIIFCPSFTSLFHINENLSDSGIELGSQNVYFESEGAFTGETSVRMLKNCGVRYVIIGHSERRHIFNENNASLNKKLHVVLDNGLVPIFCIGETFDDRNAGYTQRILKEQLAKGLDGIECQLIDRMVIAYEPVWAIGTGVNAEPKQVEDTHLQINGLLAELYPTELVKQIPILYGGSVKPENAKELIEVEGVDGFLVGGSSLKLELFSKIIEIVNNNYKG